MSGRELIRAYWAAMQANDWDSAAGFLSPGCVIDVHRLVADGDTVVSEVTVTDGAQSARLIAFSDIDGDAVVRQVEYWPTPYDPLPGREDLTRPTERVP